MSLEPSHGRRLIRKPDRLNEGHVAPMAISLKIQSTFKDWVSDRSDYSSDMTEIALAHSVGNKVEQAYRRGNMMEKRRLMMKDWAQFVLGASPSA